MFSLHIVYHCKPLLESPRKLKEKISIRCQWESFTAFHPHTTLFFSPFQLLRQVLSVDNRLQVAIQTKPFWKSFAKYIVFNFTGFYKKRFTYIPVYIYIYFFKFSLYKTPDFNASGIRKRLSGHAF